MSNPANESRDDLPVNISDLGTSIENTAADLYEEVRKTAANVLEQGKEMYDHACKRALRDGRAVDLLMHHNLYQTIAIGIGVGMLVGFLCSRRNRCENR